MGAHVGRLLFFSFLFLTYLGAAACQNAPQAATSALPDYIQEFFLSDAVRNQDRGELQLTVGVDSRQKIGISCISEDRIRSHETPATRRRVAVWHN
jgi:hypothetical protein